MQESAKNLSRKERIRELELEIRKTATQVAKVIPVPLEQMVRVKKENTRVAALLELRERQVSMLCALGQELVAERNAGLERLERASRELAAAKGAIGAEREEQTLARRSIEWAVAPSASAPQVTQVARMHDDERLKAQLRAAWEELSREKQSNEQLREECERLRADVHGLLRDKARFNDEIGSLKQKLEVVDARRFDVEQHEAQAKNRFDAMVASFQKKWIESEAQKRQVAEATQATVSSLKDRSIAAEKRELLLKVELAQARKALDAKQAELANVRESEAAFRLARAQADQAVDSMKEAWAEVDRLTAREDLLCKLFK